MALFIEMTAPDGNVSRIPANGPSTVLEAQPGYQYRLISDGAAGPIPVGQVRRVGQNLSIELGDATDSIELSDFFAAQNAGCSFSVVELGGTDNETITAQSEPIAALTSGGFLLWAAPDTGTLAPVDPGSEMNWRPVAALGGGLALTAGAAAGGGGDAVASDRTPPSAPTVNTDLNSNSTRPVIEGTAEANSKITITIDIGDSGQRVSYNTVADNNGNWSVDLDRDTPFAGALPPEGLPTDTASTARVIATDPAGNAGPVAVASITIDITPPTQTARIDSITSDAPAPVDEHDEPTTADGVEIAPGRLADGDQTNDGTPTLAGTLSGPLEDGERVVIWRGDQAAGEATIVGLTWTFTDQNFPSGTYTYTARVTDRAGNATASDNSITIEVDAIAPPAPLIEIVSADDIINFNDAQQPIIISGTAEANSRVFVQFGAVTQQTTAGIDGSWQLSFNDTQLPGNGSHDLVVTARDAFGNTSEAATRPIIVVTGLPTAPVFDTSAQSILGGPVAAINAAEAGDLIVLNGTADPGNTVQVTLTPTGGGQPVTTTQQVGANGVFSATFAPALLPDGNYTAQAVATDGVGNVINGPALPILIDTAAPTGTARINSIVDDEGSLVEVGNNGLINDNSPTLRGDASGLADGDLVRIFRNGEAIGRAQVSGGAWSYTDNALADGTYSYSVIVSDVAGNNGPASTATFNVTIDTNPPPAPTVFQVAGDNLITGAEAAGGIVISGTAEANSQVRVDWAGLIRTTTSDGSGAWSVGYGDLPADGLTQVTATVVDAAGNEASAFQTVRIDTQPPAAPSIDNVTDNNQINAAEAAGGIQISGRSEANAVINLLWDGVAARTTANGSGFWSVNYGAPPAQGDTTLTVSATDAGGNTGPTATRQINVDTLAPAAPGIDSVTGDDLITLPDIEGGVTITGSAEAGSSVAITWGSVTQTAQANGGQWSTTFNTLPGGNTGAISAVATDAAGNTSNAGSRSVTVDNTPPPPDTPSINDVASDNVVNANEANSGVVISGSTAANATVAVTWGGNTLTETANASGAYSVTFAPAQVPNADATVSVIASNAGGSSAAATRNVVVDRAPPGAPAIDDVTGDNVITLPEIENGVTVTGSAEAGSSVAITWGSVTQTAQANGGQWSTTFNTLPGGNTGAISAVATDAAGNTSNAGSRAVTVDNTPPPPPPPNTPSINDVASDNVVNANEANSGVVISGSTAANATVAVTWGGTTLTETANASGAYSVTFAPAQVPNADATVSVTASNAGGSSAAATRNVVVDRAPPGAPAIDDVTGDNVITLPEIENGVTVTGSAEAGSSVAITWGSVTQTAQANGGQWSTTFNTLPGGNTGAISAVATDAAGNTSNAGSRAITVDNTPPPPPPPDTPSINDVASDNVVNANEANSGVVISGSTAANATVAVTWGGTTLTETANASGAYSVTFAPAQVPNADATVSVIASNAGGSSAPATHNVEVDRAPPDAPTIDDVTGDNLVDSGEAAAGVSVTGSAEAGTSIAVNWGGLFETTTAEANGSWEVLFDTVPEDGLTSIQAVSTDIAGNESAPGSNNGVTVAADNVVVPTITIVDLLDDVGATTGPIDYNGETDDSQPEVVINLSDPLGVGQALEVLVDGDLDRTYNTGSNFSDEINNSLTPGAHTFSAQITDGSGAVLSTSDIYLVTFTDVP